MFPSSFRTRDNLALHCHLTQPRHEPPRANVIFIHGLGDHSRALPYRNLTEHLSENGFALYGFDLRGFGRSEGRRAFVENWSLYRDDLRVLVDLVRRGCDGQPLFLIGLSFGGLIALNYAEYYPDEWRGIIAVAPALDASGASASLRFLLPLIARIAPRLRINPRLDLNCMSRDSAAVDEYTRDPLVHISVTPRLAVQTIKAIAETRQHAERLRTPLLILHGSADRIVPPSCSADFLEAAGSADKQRHLYPGAFHNLFIETNRDEVFHDIENWMEERL